MGIRNEIEVEYIIKGTMSPPNLNLPPNEVVIMISLTDDFKDYVEIVRKVTDVSGIIKCEIPDDYVGRKYYVKIATTNYPMERILEL